MTGLARYSTILPALALLLCGVTTGLADDPPLHQQVDSLLSQKEVGVIAGLADDAQFLRRVSLDLIGRVPTTAEVRKFLADQREDKRVHAVDRLLSSDEFAHHMATVFDLMLMERRGDAHVKTDDFREYLRASFADGKPYDVLAREILAADGTEEKTRAASAFYLERAVEPTLLTRDLGRVFFGKDVQCAQCHDHPLIDDYTQTDFYGLNAFVVRASLFRPDTKKPGLIAEKADGEASFKSVFTEREGFSGPRVPGGEELAEAILKPGEQYVVAPAKNVRPIPKQSRLAALAEAATQPTNADFNRNIVNRLWAHMFGRGLVHPVDLMHSGNPPTHPEVLALLAERFPAMKYDVKAMLRELALTQAYQRSYQLPSSLTQAAADAQARVAQLEAEQKQRQEEAAAAYAKVDAVIEKLDKAIADSKPLKDAVKKANDAVTAAIKTRDAAAGKVAASEKTLTAKTSQLGLVTEAIASTQKAADAIKDDADLKAALDALTKKSQALTGETTKLNETIATQKQALQAEEQKLQAANKAADETIAPLQNAQDGIRALRAELIAVRKASADATRIAKSAEREAEFLKSLVAYEAQTQQIGSLTKAIADNDATLKAAQADLTAKEQALAAAVNQEKQAAGVLTKSQQAAAATGQALKEQQQTAALLNESLAKAQQASGRIQGDAKLAEAITSLETSIETQNAAVTTADEANQKAIATIKSDEQKQAAAKTQVQTATTAANTAKANVATAQQTLQKNREQLATTQTQKSETWDKLVETSVQRSNVAAVTGLTPEQFGWSVLRTTGQYDRQVAAERAKLDKATPLSEEDQKNPEKLAERARQSEEAARKTLTGTVKRIVGLYGNGKGQPQDEFFATAEQALFLANGGEIRGWLSPSGENLTGRLLKLEAPEQVADELYVSILSRTPSPEEVSDITAYLAARPDKKRDAVQEIAWAVLTSVEFRFRH